MRNVSCSAAVLRTADSAKNYSIGKTVDVAGVTAGTHASALVAASKPVRSSELTPTEVLLKGGRGRTGDHLIISHVLDELGYDRHVLLRYQNKQYADADLRGMSRNYQVLGPQAVAQLFDPLTTRVLQQGRLVDWDCEPELLKSCLPNCDGESATSGHRRVSVVFELSHSTYVCHVSRSSPDWPSLDDNALAQLVGALYLMSTQLESLRQQSGNFGTNAVSLTAREIETINWCKFGKTYAEVGAILGISSKTVEFHMTNVMRKLRVNDKTSAIVSAASRGLISF